MRQTRHPVSPPRSDVAREILHWVIVSPMVFTHLHRSIFIFDCPHAPHTVSTRQCSVCKIVAVHLAYSGNSNSKLRRDPTELVLSKIVQPSSLTIVTQHGKATLGEAEDRASSNLDRCLHEIRSLHLVFHSIGDISSRVWDVKGGGNGI